MPLITDSSRGFGREKKRIRIRAAIEIKSSPTLRASDLRGLKTFGQDYPEVPLYLLCPDGGPRNLGENIEQWPWMRFVAERLPALVS